MVVAVVVVVVVNGVNQVAGGVVVAVADVEVVVGEVAVVVGVVEGVDVVETDQQADQHDGSSKEMAKLVLSGKALRKKFGTGSDHGDVAACSQTWRWRPNC